VVVIAAGAVGFLIAAIAVGWFLTGLVLAILLALGNHVWATFGVLVLAVAGLLAPIPFFRRFKGVLASEEEVTGSP
jgi:hypothetical protein